MGANAGKLAPEDLSGYILKLARELYSHYHSKLQSSHVCDKIAETIQLRLQSFPEDQLEVIAKAIKEKKITLPEAFTKDFPENLEDADTQPLDYFVNQYVSIPTGLRKDGNKLSLPYLSQRVFQILEQQQTGGLMIINTQKEQPQQRQQHIPIKPKTPTEILDDLNKELQDTLRVRDIQQPPQPPQQLPPSPVKKNKTILQKEIQDDLCRVIANHYMLRANLVGAIASVLPLRTDQLGFCQERIRALETGMICLPSGWLSDKTAEELADGVGSYIQHFHVEQCERQGGRFRERKFDANSELGKLFIRHVEKMKEKYQVFLRDIKETLETLMNQQLTNPDLYILTKRTKDKLEKFYITCQLDYVIGVLTLLQMDSRKPPLTPEGESNLKHLMALD